MAAGFTEAGAVDIDGLTYEEEIRRICEGNSCRNYGASWACPPAVGALDACRRQCGQYGHMILFNRKYPLEDPFDYDGMVGALRDFKARVEALDEAIVPWIGKRLMLSNEGCGRVQPLHLSDSPAGFPIGSILPSRVMASTSARHGQGSRHARPLRPRHGDLLWGGAVRLKGQIKKLP